MWIAAGSFWVTETAPLLIWHVPDAWEPRRDANFILLMALISKKHTILKATFFHAVTTGTGMVVPYQCQPESDPQTLVHSWLIILSRNKERRGKKKCTRYFIDLQHTELKRDLQNCLISKLTNRWFAWTKTFYNEKKSWNLHGQIIHPYVNPDCMDSFWNY